MRSQGMVVVTPGMTTQTVDRQLEFWLCRLLERVLRLHKLEPSSFIPLELLLTRREGSGPKRGAKNSGHALSRE
jgi:hypothetical protein